MPYIQLEGIFKSYGNLKAVDNVSLEISRGEVFGLLGPNGAGKSTLISIICTLLSPDSGDVLVDGMSIRSKPTQVKKLIGIVPQEVALYPTLTAWENLLFWGRMYGMSGSNLKQRAKEALDIAGLSERKSDRIETYSGGMKRRINIAAALLHTPSILIMDEPTVGIDPQSRNHILETVLKLNSEGMTIIYTSHYMEEVEYICKRTAIMDHGKVIAKGTGDELKKLVGDKDTISIKAYNIQDSTLEGVHAIDGVEEVIRDEDGIRIVTDDADSVLAGVVAKVEQGDASIQSIRIEEPNLESVFLHLTGRALRD